ncbi:MAG: ATP-binding protein, partial [Eubacterium sp.]|nr:ATP-binding protein [Eubacterium sp.]
KIIEDYAVKEENRLLQSQIDSYQYQFEQIKESQAVISRIEHDIEKHLLALKLDLKNAQPREAELKIDALIGNLRLAENVADSGYTDMDAILNYKAMQASAFGIRMTCDLRLPYTLNINTTDLAVILGNALDNAIEACKTAESSMREISIAIKYDKHNLSMTITNPFTGEIKTDAAGELITTKSKGRHGIGLRSIQEAAEKYNGLTDITAENNRFTLKILLLNLSSQ